VKTKTKTYDATATRSGRWWAVEVHEMPKGHLALTQGRTLKEAEAMAREAIALLLAVPEAAIVVRLRVAGAEEALASVERARRDRETAAREEQATLARAAADLAARGISQRDAARLLGLSHQRVSQLLRTDAA